MFTSTLKTRREAQQLLFIESLNERNRYQLRSAFSQGSGLIDDQSVDFAKHFDCLGILEQDAGLSPLAGGNHDRHRRCQAKRAGARNNQHGDGVNDCISHSRFWAHGGPHNKRDDRDQNHSRNKVTRNDVCQFLNGRAATLSFYYHLHDLRQQSFGPYSLRFHNERAGPVDGCADYAIARFLLNWDWFTGDHRFINRAIPFDHDTIHRNLLAGTNAEVIAFVYLVKRNVLFTAIRCNPPRSLRRQTKQRPDRGARRAAGLKFQHLA